MRAVELSTGAFCTEFRCEQLWDDDIFWIGVKILIFAPPPRGWAKNLRFDPDPKNVVITKLFAPKFCAEWSNREVHSFHGDPVREKSEI